MSEEQRPETDPPTGIPRSVHDGAAKIIAGDERAADERSEPTLRFMWNLPTGTTPHIPLWLSLLFFGGLLFAIILTLTAR